MRVLLPLAFLLLRWLPLAHAGESTESIQQMVPEVAGTLAKLLPQGWGETFNLSKVTVKVVDRKEFRRAMTDYGMENSGSKGPVRRALKRVGVSIASRLIGAMGMYLPSPGNNQGTLYLVKEELSNPNRIKGFLAHELTHAAQHQAHAETFLQIQKKGRTLVDLSGGKRQSVLNELLQLRMVAEGQAVMVQLALDPDFVSLPKAKTLFGRLKQRMKQGVLRVAHAASKTLRNISASYSVGTAVGHPVLSDALWTDGAFRQELLKPTVDAMNKISGWSYLRKGARVFRPIGKELAGRADAILQQAGQQMGQPHQPRVERAPVVEQQSQAKPPTAGKVGGVKRWIRNRLDRVFKRRR